MQSMTMHMYALMINHNLAKVQPSGQTIIIDCDIYISCKETHLIVLREISGLSG